VVAAATAVAAWETFDLLGAAGYPSLSWLGVVFAVAIVLDPAVGQEVDPSGMLLLAIGSILAAIGAFTRPDPREGLPTWFATVFGAIYASFLGFIIRLGHEAPAVPVGAPLAGLGAERGWIVLLVLGVWAYDTGAYFIGKRFGRRRFLTHISPSKTYAGLIGGVDGGPAEGVNLSVSALLGMGLTLVTTISEQLAQAMDGQAGALAHAQAASAERNIPRRKRKL